MPTLADIQAVDCLGFGKYGERQCAPMIQMLLRTGRLSSDPPRCQGQGIVIAGGGPYLDWAWVVCKVIRATGCALPIQVWYLKADEMPAWAVPLFKALGAETVNASDRLRLHPHRMLLQYIGLRKWTYAGWVLKNYAVEHAPWEQVLFLDADCFPSVDPTQLMDSPEVRQSGGLFFSDIANWSKSPWVYSYCGLAPAEKEWEAGQYIVNKNLGWMGLRWANFLNEHSDVWFTLTHGDKGTLELGFRISKVPHLVSTDCRWEGWGISQRWDGKECFRHSMAFKRREAPAPSPQITAFFWEWQSLTP